MQSSQVSISKEKKDLKEFNYETFVAMILRALKKRGDGKIAEMLEKKWEKNIWWFYPLILVYKQLTFEINCLLMQYKKLSIYKKLI